MVGGASYAAIHLIEFGDSAAYYGIWVLAPGLALSIALLCLSLVRGVERFPVKVYAGDHPVVKKLVRRPSFQRDYSPPSWAVGWLPQAMLYLAKSWLNSHCQGYRREPVQLPDGEHVSLLWMVPHLYDSIIATAVSKGQSFGDALSCHIPVNMPIIIVCHGVFQSPADLYEFVHFLTEKCRYTVCVFNRRGNDLPLSRARFNTVGDQQDFRFILSCLKQRFPFNRIYGVGISAGSSLLARYLGDSRDDSELDGGVLISPGYDMEKSLQYMNPFLDKAITNHAKGWFLERNQEVLAKRCPKSLHKLYRSRSMYEFHKHQHVFDDKDNSEDYFAAHNPVLVLDRITKPTVYINANDDPCFPGSFTFQFRDIVRRCPMTAILHIEKGGHGTFYENWDAGTSRAYMVVQEFIAHLEEEGWGRPSAIKAPAATKAPWTIKGENCEEDSDGSLDVMLVPQ